MTETTYQTEEVPDIDQLEEWMQEVDAMQRMVAGSNQMGLAHMGIHLGF